MKAIDRKMVRDLWGMKGQALAIILVLASGIAVFVMALTTLASLVQSQETYYDRYRFAHVFAHLKRAPNSLAERIAEVPGVSRVETRIVAAVTLDVPGLAEPGVGKLISVPESHAPSMNVPHLRGGRYVEPGRPGEVLVSEAFALSHNLKPGDRVNAVLNGRLQPLKIVGIALSPEYIFSIREGELFPDDKRFGVFWMGYTELAAAFDMQGAFNSVVLALNAEANEPEVLRLLDRITEPFGGIGAIGRADQLSHRLVTNEFSQLQGMALLTPTIFLAVTAFLLNVVMGRLINTQREQIAALRAFGYTRWDIGLHYCKLVMLLVVIGVALGTLVGAWLASALTEMYSAFFRFPVFYFVLPPNVVALALGISVAAGLLGTWSAIRRASRLPPAEAMRPEPPADFRPTILERLGLQRFLSVSVRMILRQIERKPRQALLTVTGIALATGMLVLGNFVIDAVDYVIDFQFFNSQRQDVNVAFVEPSSHRALNEVRNLPGVRDAEPYRGVAARIRSGHVWRKLGILGLESEPRLFRVLDAEQKQVRMPPEGVVLSEKLAQILEVRPGDTVTVEVLEGDRPVREVPVSGVFADYSMPSAYMHIDAVREMLREGDTLSGAFLAVDSQYLNTLYKQLKQTPKVANVSVKRAALDTFEQLLNENLLRMKAFNVFFATVICFGVVYNSARISLAERSRELATLRVIGFTRGEISMILLGELTILTLVAIPLGLMFGYGLAGFAVTVMDTETQRFPLVVSSATYAFAATVTIVAAVCSGLVVRRKLDHLDLVSVLKSRE
ncbi:MAG: FtsX-like permease family protein [Gemmataceae bacterium]|nr:FtsX-like permease family protein [Gemmataceae bacterium]